MTISSPSSTQCPESSINRSAVALGGCGSETAAVSSDSGSPTTTEYVYHPSNGRSVNTIESLDGVVRTSGSVAVVTVTDESIKSRTLSKTEQEDNRYLNLAVDELVSGAKLPATIRLFESQSVTTSKGSTGSSRDWRIDVGDKLLVVAVVPQRNGEYEFNGGLAFFPVGDAEASAALAAGRAKSVDPAAQSIGAETEHLSDEQLIEVIRSKSGGAPTENGGGATFAPSGG